MIILDIETSGVNLVKSGIWQIGAIDLDTKEEFIEDGRIDDEDMITEESLKIIGKTEQELRDPNKQSQKQLLEKFFKWVSERKINNFICQNPQFDLAFLNIKAEKYSLEKPYPYRAFDLHSIAQIKYREINGDFLIVEEKSGMTLSNALKFCGLTDERIQIRDKEVTKEGKSHNALEDAKLTAECFSRLVYGKNLFPEFSKFPVPGVLKK